MPKLYRPETGQPDAYANLQPILTRAIKWDLIRQQYDKMIKFATALRLGTTETEEILRRFTRGGVQHPTYSALIEIGKVQKTIFLGSYLQLEALRREIQEGLNVVENWNSATNFIHYGRHGEFSTNKWEDQELAMLALHLLYISLVFIQTLMIQDVLTEPAWMNTMTKEDLRGLTPLIYSNVNPYGLIRLNMTEHWRLLELRRWKAQFHPCSSESEWKHRRQEIAHVESSLASSNSAILPLVSPMYVLALEAAASGNPE